MPPSTLEARAFAQAIEGWIATSGEAFVDVYHCHSGSGGMLYSVSSIATLKALMAQAERDSVKNQDGVSLTGFDRCFPIRGVVDEEWAEKVRKGYTDGWCAVVMKCTADYPVPLRFLGSVASKEEMESELSDLLRDFRGEVLWFGEHPLDTNDWAERTGGQAIKTLFGQIKRREL